MIRSWNGISAAVILLAIVAGCHTPEDKPRTKTTNFNAQWEFIRGDSSEAFSHTSAWEMVSLPHTPRIEPLLVNDQWQGTCWYKKSFTLDDWEPGQPLFLKFDGAMNVADVWINGMHALTHLGGYLPFSVDLTPFLRTDEKQEVVVRLDNTDNPVTGPKPLNILDFNMYGGLYRDVWLTKKNSVYITDPVHVAIPAGGGILVSYPEASSQQAVVDVKSHIQNSAPTEAAFEVVHELWLDDTQIIATAPMTGVLPAEEAAHFLQSIRVDNPKLWSPRSPVLYSLVTRVQAGGRVLDADTTRIGIRQFAFRDNQLYINGEKTFLRGVNRHQEYPYLGYALSREANYRDAVKIKEAGFDYVRLSHYPQSPAFMDACDELGLVVIDAILGWQYYADDPAFRRQVYQTARDLVRRDRNHACVLAWEVSLNESWMPEFFIDSLTAIAREEYPGEQCFTAGWQEYGYDIYLQARQHRLKHYDTPVKPYVVSEYGDWEYYAQNAGLNQDNWQDLREEERSSRQLRSAGEKGMLQQATNIQEAHNDNFNTPAFADGYWVMFDYNRGYADDLEASGIMSISRVPKFSYYFFRSQRDPGFAAENYSSGPMVFIASYWNDSSASDVRVFSNCEAVELYLNDSLVGRQLPDQDRISGNLAHPPLTFRLGSFTPGTLKAVGLKNDEAIATYTRNTPGEAASISLVMDESGLPPQAGVNDVLFVYASIHDARGNTIPTNDISVLFSLEGDAELLSPAEQPAELGVASALIRMGKKPGIVVVHCESAGLLAGQVEFKSR